MPGKYRIIFHHLFITCNLLGCEAESILANFFISTTLLISAYRIHLSTKPNQLQKRIKEKKQQRPENFPRILLARDIKFHANWILDKKVMGIY